MQSQLLSAMQSRAATDATQLPAQFRSRFVDAVSAAGSSGFDVGRGQSGAHLPTGIPPQGLQLLQRLFHDVFVNGYVSAMRPTLLVPVAGFILGAGACLLIARRERAGAATALEPANEPAA
jgi:hypothetical protein